MIKRQRVTLEILENDAHSRNRAAPGAADDPQYYQIDPDLRTIIEAWPNLPQAIKAAVGAILEAAESGGD